MEQPGAEHPFLAAWRLARAQGFAELDLRDMEEPRGRYVRLVLQSPPLIFKRRGDPGTNVDRVGSPYHDLVLIEEEVIAAGATAILDQVLAIATAPRLPRQQDDWPGPLPGLKRG